MDAKLRADLAVLRKKQVHEFRVALERGGDHFLDQRRRFLRAPVSNESSDSRIKRWTDPRVLLLGLACTGSTAFSGDAFT